jgi:adenylosuccinate synthase
VSLEAWIVFDLGFGDAGKGAVTDALARDRGASLVVRFNGGAQAGHTVVAPDGRRHVFSQLGAGSFVPGVRTLLGPGFVLHPGGLLVEARRLAELGVADALERLAVDARALVVTPFEQAAGRLRELGRGAARHGTCGVGVGEAVADALAGRSDVVRAADLVTGAPRRLVERLEAQRERLRAELDATRGLGDPRAADEWALLDDPGAARRTLELWAGLAGRLAVLEPAAARAAVRDAGVAIFEGAQGVLLDERWGFHPHTTWSDCTPAEAVALLAGLDARATRLGVLRAYATRHGEGPFPTAEPDHPGRRDPTNDDLGWQGAFRAGPLDLVLLRYALAVSGGADGLALSCLDRAGRSVRLCRGYRLERPPDADLVELDGDRVAALRPGSPDDLDHRARLGALLRRAWPILEPVTVDDLPAALEAALGAPVVLEGRGPSATNWRWRAMMPLPGASSPALLRLRGEG